MIAFWFMRNAWRSRAGFTLTELLAVVVIIGILAVTGITYFRKHALASKVTEAQAMVQSIRAAEEGYRAENRQYLSTIGSAALPGCSSPAGLYPAAPDGKRRSFYLQQSSTNNNNALWWRLRPSTSSPVTFGYAVSAGPPSTTTRMPVPPDLANPPQMPFPNDSWFVVEALADNDTDGVCCLVAGTSLNGEVYVQNEGE
jgi:prepilin-type N-terminal cleavage/methylation domain-containing protein